ncbi:Histidine kinase-, DNA gyrase B-, and HSP90-like ATPase [Marinobacter daqiaonensis]|uniref:histidine kinase n=1 Tax=Marinobacter daqiaonensis TaxID=650891 RepID=A0A1I6HQS0_9GAMM|nr:ATP-binding protein [Marinobacter daqiaonensis]SFR56793.1 Histidine kinase-, DNA gyrase B-, and HSP90-like ATPase [Marinobacter daqiaonensis]
MRRSIRSSLLMLVGPFALTFPLAAWVIHSRLGPALDRPLISNCTERGYSATLCAIQADILPWAVLGAGILVLLLATTFLGLVSVRTALRGLQADLLDYQKGHRSSLSQDVPREMEPLVQQLNRILAANHRAPGMTMNTTLKSSGEAPAGTVTARQQPEEAPEDFDSALFELDAVLGSRETESAVLTPSPEPRYTPPEPPAKEPEKPAAPEAPQVPETDAEEPAGTPTPAPSRKNIAFPVRKCRKIIAMLEQRHPDVNFELITDVGEDVSWSIREAELTGIFGQLLDNAGKWANSQVNVFLAIKGNMLVFGVADDGPGVPPELTPKLGEAGFRGDGEKSGNGVGLALVRRVMDSHGGSLAFDRSRLGGLEAIIALPGAPVPRHSMEAGLYH